MNMETARAETLASLTKAAEQHRAKRPDAWPAFTFGSFCLQLALAAAAAQTPEELAAMAEKVRDALNA